MSIRITVLVENERAADAVPGVEGEHGLSLLVETDSARVLFDAGSTGLVARNAEMLGLGTALARLDAIVLSHGHYDHTGGLAEVLRWAGRRTPVFVRPGFFARKMKRESGGLADIGVLVTRSEIEELGGVIAEEPGPREILPGVFVSGEIARHVESANAERSLLTENARGEITEDTFPEEQALAVRMASGIAVLVGCAHRGLVESVAAAREASGQERVRAILGGAHLRSASDDEIDRVVCGIARLGPELVALGHCTGESAERHFMKALGKRVRPLRAGSSLALE